MGLAALDQHPPEPFTEARLDIEELITYLRLESTKDLPHSEVERELETQGRELLRKLYQAHLDDRGPGEVSGPVQDAEGDERSQTRLQSRSLKSIFGPVGVERFGYGKEGSASLHPLDGELNLPTELYSHEMSRKAAVEISKNSYDEVQESLLSRTGTKVPKRQLEEMAVRAAQDFDAFYEQRSATPEESPGSLMILSFDAKGVVMHRKDLRPATRKAAEQSDSKSHKGDDKASGKKDHRKRMAEVAAVYTIDPFVRTPHQVMRRLAPIHEAAPGKRPKPENKRVWASVEKDPEKVIEQAFQEALKRDPGFEKKWVVLVDGNEAQLNITHKLKKRTPADLSVILDLMHVSEYVWAASRAFHEEPGPERSEWVSDKLLRILCGESSGVAAGIRRSATLRALSQKQRQEVDRCAGYLLKYRAYLRYDECLEQGFPIATGVIEGACRHLVKDRMELTGACWRLVGAEAVLRLRALRSSGDFEDYWRFHEAQEYQRNHAAHYAEREVPATKATQENKNPHLKLVK